jgi:hypothetical protein
VKRREDTPRTACRHFIMERDTSADMKETDGYNRRRVSSGIYCMGADGPRVMIVGNSITFHEPNADIGWEGSWGMAASAQNKDYVSLLYKKVCSVCGDAVFCVAHAGAWERAFWDTSSLNPLKTVKEFSPDVFIFRLGENILPKTCEQYSLSEGISRLVSFLTVPQKTKMIFTTCFWENPIINPIITKSAGVLGARLVELSDLGSNDKMKATGLFEHSGVAVHPNDAGMNEIVRRIWEELRLML